MLFMYVDGFRGFSNQFIEWKDVNFLVGENSTGKTTILKVLKFLSSQVFWLTGEIASVSLTDDESDDINSFFRGGSAGGSFTLGYADFYKDENSFNDIKCITFSINNNELKIVSCSYNLGKEMMFFRMTNKSIFYKKIELDTSRDELAFFKKCIDIHKDKLKRGYSKINSDIPNHFPVLYLHYLVKKRSNENENFLNIKLSLNKQDVKLMDPIRAKPEKIYSPLRIGNSTSGRHAPYILDKLLYDKKNKKDDFFNKIKLYGIESGMFNDIDVVHFNKNKHSPFELKINLPAGNFPIFDVGYGVSQVLPILLESARGTSVVRLAIQQPEVHLHPRAQATLGEYLYNSFLTKSKGSKFFIETHSDFIIDRFRLSIKKNTNNEVKAQVLFFEKTEIGNRVSHISIDSDGKYSRNQPDNFKDFFLQEELAVIGI